MFLDAILYFVEAKVLMGKRKKKTLTGDVKEKVYIVIKSGGDWGKKGGWHS